MLVEILHRSDGDICTITQTLDVSATSDVSVCELAYYHTKTGSIAHLQSPHIRATELGDIIAIVPDVDDRTSTRMFVLESVEAATDTPAFRRIESSTVKLSHGD